MDKDQYIQELEEQLARLQLDNDELRAQIDGEVCCPIAVRFL